LTYPERYDIIRVSRGKPPQGAPKRVIKVHRVKKDHEKSAKKSLLTNPTKCDIIRYQLRKVIHTMLNINFLKKNLQQRLDWCKNSTNFDAKKTYLNQAYGMVDIFSQLAWANEQTALQNEVYNLWCDYFGPKFHEAVYGE
jgi:hypothetical protein